jgi:hypothetical protein
MNPLACEGWADSPVTVVSLPGRGRPPQAAARRAGLEDVEKLLTDSMVALLDGTPAGNLPTSTTTCRSIVVWSARRSRAMEEEWTDESRF